MTKVNAPFRQTRPEWPREASPPIDRTAAPPPGGCCRGRAGCDGRGHADAEERPGVSTRRQARRRAERTPAGATVAPPTNPGPGKEPLPLPEQIRQLLLDRAAEGLRGTCR